MASRLGARSASGMQSCWLEVDKSCLRDPDFSSPPPSSILLLTDDIRLLSLGEKRKLRAARGSGITATILLLPKFTPEGRVIKHVVHSFAFLTCYKGASKMLHCATGQWAMRGAHRKRPRGKPVDARTRRTRT